MIIDMALRQDTLMCKIVLIPPCLDEQNPKYRTGPAIDEYVA
jgi:hypothetical protein